MKEVEIESSWDDSIVAMVRPRLSRPDVVERAGAQAGEGKHQQMRERSLASAASPSAVVSGCACGTRRARYTTSSQDAGSGPGAQVERASAERKEHPAGGCFASGYGRAVALRQSQKWKAEQEKSGRREPSRCAKHCDT
jgi:hypothetical protein